MVPKIKLIHECGNIIQVSFINIRRQAYGCHNSDCQYRSRSGSQKYSEDQWMDKIKQNDSEKKQQFNIIRFDLASRSKKVIIRHKVCGKEEIVTIDNFLKDSFNCNNPDCKFQRWSNANKKDLEVLTRNLYPLSDYQKQFDIEVIRDGNRLKVKALHNLCNEITVVDYHQFKKDRFCCHSPECQKKRSGSYTSFEERYLLEYIQSLGIRVEKAPYGKYCPYELDTYLPDYKMAFEYNGLYWHSTHSRGRAKGYHASKSKVCLSHGIKVYHLWEGSSVELYKSFIANKLGLSKRIYARSLKVVIPTKEQQMEFYNNYHFHKYSINKITFGLEKDGVIYSMISLRQSYGVFEIARYAVLQGYCVIGGFEKLMKECIRFSKSIGVDQLVTHLYNDICPDYHDSVYYKYGFKYVHDSGPTMYYYDLNSKKLMYRHKLQKHLLKDLYPEVYDENLTEIEILAKKNIVPLYDSGTTKFILDI